MKLYKTHIRVVTDFGTDIKIENSLVKILANNFEEAKNNIEKLIMNDEISIIANKPFSEVLINVDREYEESFEDSPSFSEEILEDVYIN